MLDFELTATPSAQAQMEGARLSPGEVRDLIREQESQGFRLKLPGPGNIFYIRRPTRLGLAYIEYTPVSDDTIQARAVVIHTGFAWSA
jgi:hypothetical protein